MAGMINPRISLAIHIQRFHSNESRSPALTLEAELRINPHKVQAKKTSL